MDSGEISVHDFKNLSTRVLDVATETKVQNNIDRGGHFQHITMIKEIFFMIRK